MADARARRHHLEIVERLRSPFEELVALEIAVIFELDVVGEGLGRAELVDHHRVIDDEVDGDERVDLGRVAAEPGDRIAHRREIDDAGDAGEILHQHARGAILDLAVRAGVLLPIDQRLGIGLGDGDAVLEAQHVFQEDLHREGEAADVAELLRRLGERVIGVGLTVHAERVAGGEGIFAGGGHGARVPSLSCRRRAAGEAGVPRGRGGRAGAPGVFADAMSREGLSKGVGRGEGWGWANQCRSASHDRSRKQRPPPTSAAQAAMGTIPAVKAIRSAPERLRTESLVMRLAR